MKPEPPEGRGAHGTWRRIPKLFSLKKLPNREREEPALGPDGSRGAASPPPPQTRHLPISRILVAAPDPSLGIPRLPPAASGAGSPREEAAARRGHPETEVLGWGTPRSGPGGVPGYPQFPSPVLGGCWGGGPTSSASTGMRMGGSQYQYWDSAGGPNSAPGTGRILGRGSRLQSRSQEGLQGRPHLRYRYRDDAG